MKRAACHSPQQLPCRNNPVLRRHRRSVSSCQHKSLHNSLAQKCFSPAGSLHASTRLPTAGSSIPECEIPTMPFPQPLQEAAHQGETISPTADERHDSSPAEAIASSSKQTSHPPLHTMHGALQTCRAGIENGKPDSACPNLQRHALADLPVLLQNAQSENEMTIVGEHACGSERHSADCPGKRPGGAFRRWRHKKVKRGSLQDVWFRKGQAV